MATVDKSVGWTDAKRKSIVDFALEIQKNLKIERKRKLKKSKKKLATPTKPIGNAINLNGKLSRFLAKKSGCTLEKV